MTSNWEPKYCHVVGYHCSWLDHRCLPEVGALLAAKMSRVPKGGIIARYRELVENIAKSLWEDPDTIYAEQRNGTYYEWDVLKKMQPSMYQLVITAGEDQLTAYTDGKLHPVIQEWFNQNVLKYGHGSVKELA